MYGRVCRAHGVRGGLRIAWYHDLGALVRAPKRLQLRLRDGSEQVFPIDSIRPLGGDSLVQLSSIDAPEVARQFHGAQVAIDQALVPSSAAGERYLFELVGLMAHHEDGTALGWVEAVYDHGAAPLLALRSATGQEMLVPLLDDTIRRTDLQARRVVLRPLAGLW